MEEGGEVVVAILSAAHDTQEEVDLQTAHDAMLVAPHVATPLLWPSKPRTVQGAMLPADGTCLYPAVVLVQVRLHNSILAVAFTLEGENRARCWDAALARHTSARDLRLMRPEDVAPTRA
jgi:hypothetical protein